MANERQVMDFIFDAKVGPLMKGLELAEKGATKFGAAIDAAFDIGETARATGQPVSSVVKGLGDKGLDVSGFQRVIAEMTARFPLVAKSAQVLSGILGKGLMLGLQGLNKVLEAGMDLWKDFFLQMEDMRKSAGLTRTEVQDFTAEVISATGKYGIALDKVTQTTFFLRKGLNRSNEELAKLAAGMENFNDLTNTSMDTTRELGRLLLMQLDVPDAAFQKSLFAIRAIGRESGVLTDSLMASLSDAGDFIRSRGKENALAMTNMAASISAAMQKQGASLSSVNEALNALGNQRSPLANLFKTAGGDLESFAAQFNELFQATQSTDKVMQSMAEQDFAERFQLSKEAARALAESLKDVSALQGLFSRTMDKDLVTLEKQEEAMLGPIQRLGRQWNKILTDVASVASAVFGPGSMFFEAVEDLSQTVEAVVAGIKWVVGRETKEDIDAKTKEAARTAKSRIVGDLRRSNVPHEDVLQFISRSQGTPPTWGDNKALEEKTDRQTNVLLQVKDTLEGIREDGRRQGPANNPARLAAAVAESGG